MLSTQSCTVVFLFDFQIHFLLQIKVCNDVIKRKERTGKILSNPRPLKSGQELLYSIAFLFSYIDHNSKSKCFHT